MVAAPLSLLLVALAAAPTAAPAPAPASLPMPPPPPPSREAWPLAEVSVGGSMLSRGATFCAAPLEAWCGKDANLTYSTSLPYLGAAARVMAFPFARGEAVEWRGLGFEGRYGWGATFVEDGTASALATDQAWSAELLYRQHVEVLGFRPWLGARLGAGSRGFSVPDTVEGLQLRRGVGPALGMDAGLTLLGAALRLELTFRYAMGARPSAGERELYGDGVSSDGFFASAGLAGAFGAGGDGDGLGWSASLEQQLFLDTFRGLGTRAPTGAWVMEQYTALTAGLRYRF